MLPPAHFSDFFHSIYRGVVPESDFIHMAVEPDGFRKVAQYLGSLPFEFIESEFMYDGIQAVRLNGPKNVDLKHLDIKIDGVLVTEKSRWLTEISATYPPTRTARFAGRVLRREPNVVIAAWIKSQGSGDKPGAL